MTELHRRKIWPHNKISRNSVEPLRPRQARTSFPQGHSKSHDQRDNHTQHIHLHTSVSKPPRHLSAQPLQVHSTQVPATNLPHEPRPAKVTARPRTSVPEHRSTASPTPSSAGAPAPAGAPPHHQPRAPASAGPQTTRFKDLLADVVARFARPGATSPVTVAARPRHLLAVLHRRGGRSLGPRAARPRPRGGSAAVARIAHSSAGRGRAALQLGPVQSARGVNQRLGVAARAPRRTPHGRRGAQRRQRSRYDARLRPARSGRDGGRRAGREVHGRGTRTPGPSSLEPVALSDHTSRAAAPAAPAPGRAPRPREAPARPAATRPRVPRRGPAPTPARPARRFQAARTRWRRAPQAPATEAAITAPHLAHLLLDRLGDHRLRSGSVYEAAPRPGRRTGTSLQPSPRPQAPPATSSPRGPTRPTTRWFTSTRRHQPLRGAATTVPGSSAAAGRGT